jgi:hypothetical protein
LSLLASAPHCLRGAKRTIIILSLALAGCQGVVAHSPPEADSLRLWVDDSTAPLLHELTTNYNEKAGLAWDVRTADAPTLVGLLRSVESSGVPYALMNVLPGYLPGRLNPPLWMIPVGFDGVAIIVHPSNPITQLTTESLRAILQGRITNWNQVGGEDRPLTLIARDERGSVGGVMQAAILGSRRVSRAARLAPTSAAAAAMVSADPNAISYVSVGYLRNESQVRVVPLNGILPTPQTLTSGAYPIRTQIVFAGREEPTASRVREFFAWVQSAEGQAIVGRQHGTLQ